MPREVLLLSQPTYSRTLSWLIGSESPTLLVSKEQKLPPGRPRADRQAGTGEKGPTGHKKGEDGIQLGTAGGEVPREAEAGDLAPQRGSGKGRVPKEP